MRIFKLGGSALALAAALGGYTQFRYTTLSPCGAAEQAVRAEMPKVLDELADTDMRFKALKVGGALLGGGAETVAKGAAAELAARDIANKSVVECVWTVANRELNPSGFRKDLGERFADQLAQKLAF